MFAEAGHALGGEAATFWAALLVTSVGLGMLLFGGDALVRGACGLAQSLGVSPRTIGLTLVGFGTSAPELAVNVAAAGRGHAEMCFGNIFGSNLANVGLIVGVAALLRPLSVHRLLVVRDLPLLLIVTLAACLMGSVPQGGATAFSATEGAVLLVGFGGFMLYMARSFSSDRAACDERDRGAPRKRQILLALGGLVGLLLGARLTVDGATEVARGFGVSDALIGLTLLAIGTSLPELVTSVVATYRGQIDLAVGNVVGSNLFNLLLVLGSTTMVASVPVPPAGRADLWVSLAASVALLLASRAPAGQVRRWQGGLLVTGYLGYILARSVSG